MLARVNAPWSIRKPKITRGIAIRTPIIMAVVLVIFPFFMQISTRTTRFTHSFSVLCFWLSCKRKTNYMKTLIITPNASITTPGIEYLRIFSNMPLCGNVVTFVVVTI